MTQFKKITLQDFEQDPEIIPVKYSDGFVVLNRKEVVEHYKRIEPIPRKRYFRKEIKRLLWISKSRLSKKFYIGQVLTGLGDLMGLSHLPRLIKMRSEKSKVYVYSSDFAEDVFLNNPFIDGFTDAKGVLWNKKGSGTDLGSGHLTQMKARFFGLGECPPKGDLFISDEEKKSFQSYANKSLATIHVKGKTHDAPVPDEIWAGIVEELRKTHFVMQLKGPHEKAIPNVDGTMTGIRNCIVCQSFARVHVGIDSGFTHTAAALDVPAVVIVDKITTQAPLLKDGVHQLVLPHISCNHLDFLYPQHSYLCVGPATPKAPPLTRVTLRMAINGEIYPFRNKLVWDF